jgi:ribosomal protein L11 methyltransferase
VLAISAVKVGSLDTLATDIDPEAVRVASANAKLNGVGPRLKALSAAGLHHSMIQRQAPYDLIFANILARPLIELAPGLAGILTSAGELILSGLTRDQVRWVSAPYRNCGLVLQRRILLGNWATLVFTRPKSKRPDRFRAGRSIHQARAPGWETEGM